MLPVQMLTNALSVTSLLLLRTEGLGAVGAITIDKEGRMSTKETGAGKGNPEVGMQNAIFEKDSSKLYFFLEKCMDILSQFNQVAHKREVSEPLQPIS